MGEVTLAMPGPWAKDYREGANHYTTKFGGLPDWPIPEVDVRPDFLKCGACGSQLCLVVQVYAPTLCDTLKIEERIIYVFGCTMQTCGSSPLSWRALRVQKSNSEEASPSSEEVASLAGSSAPVSNNKWLEEDLWTHDSGEDDGDVTDDDLDLEELGRKLSEAANLVSHSKKQNFPQQRETAMNGSPANPIAGQVDTSIPVIPCFYIYYQEESLSRDVSTICSNYSPSLEKEVDLDDNKKDEKWEEGYEYDRALYVDRTYMKFKKRLDAYPEQCLRYSYGGKPLLASIELEVPANCGLCGGSRHYEMQLMPPLLYFLWESQDWNWMTLIVYTCSKSCSRTTNPVETSSNNSWTVAEETVIVQFEEPVRRIFNTSSELQSMAF